MVRWAGIVPEFCLDWGLGTEEDAAPRPSDDDMLAAHALVIADSRKVQQHN